MKFNKSNGIGSGIKYIDIIVVCLSLVIFNTNLYAQKITAQSIKKYVYEPNRVYTIETGLGLATQIVIDPSEQVKDIGTGFSAGWDILRRDNIFILKPKDPDAETNMFIRTDKRSYLFDLKIVTKDWKKIEEAKSLGVVYQIEFTYHDAISKNSAPKTITPRPAADPLTPIKSPYLSYYTDYEAASESGSKWMIPTRVYDDGELTYIKMPPMGSAPAFFGRSTDRGEEFVLNRSMKNGMHVLQGVYPFIVVRYNDEVIAIRRR
jgi:type IV secretion system protein VirB9